MLADTLADVLRATVSAGMCYGADTLQCSVGTNRVQGGSGVGCVRLERRWRSAAECSWFWVQDISSVGLMHIEFSEAMALGACCWDAGGGMLQSALSSECRTSHPLVSCTEWLDRRAHVATRISGSFANAFALEKTPSIASAHWAYMLTYLLAESIGCSRSHHVC